MLNAASFAAVRRTVEGAVERAALPASFRELLRIPLQQHGKILTDDERPLWPAVVLAACRSAGGESAFGVTVAAATELFMTGLDVLDEVEDGDSSALVELAGPAQALNVSTALLLLGQQILLGLVADGLPPTRVALLAQTLTAAGLAATGGQHRDLANESDQTVSTDEALSIARSKAGTLVAGACRMGALLGTTDTDTLALYETLGGHHGTAAQLANDLHGAENTANKTDVERQKGTLPLLYARAVATGEPATIAASGALHFTWVILEIERQRCVQLLDTLAARGHLVADLRDLLGKVG